MAVLSSDKFVNELRERLGLPDGTTKFTLTAAVDEIVTIDCTYYPNPKMVDEDGVIPIKQTRFKLVEIDD